MHIFTRMLAILRFNFLALAAASLLVACGGGGDSGSSTMSGATPAPLTTTPSAGKVAILLTDAPTDAFCQNLATIERIDLLGPGSPTNVYTGPVTVDLLRLRNYTDFFAIDAEVPIGTYTKVRLTLSDLALVQCDSAGNPEPASGWEHPHLPGNGKLDLNPRSQFAVVGGETLVIRFDLDMGKSLHVHQTGNGKWQFRPVIFCDIKPAEDKLVRVFGAAQNISGTQFQLCRLRPAASMDGGSSAPSSECLDVFTDADTGIFDATGARVGLSAVANGDLLTAIGFLDLYDDADGDTRLDDLRLDAVVVELGDRGTFKRYVGQVVSAPGNNDLFVFDPLFGPTLTPMPLNTPSDAIDVRLQSGTRIFALGSNQELTSAALQPGALGQVDGVFTIPATSGEPLKSSLIVLEQNTTPAVSLLDAVIDAPIPADDDNVPATRRFNVKVGNEPARCVKTDAGTRYLLITETASTSDTTEISFDKLAANDTVDVFGATDATDTACVLADAVQKYAP